MILKYNEKVPTLGKQVFVAENAVIIGDVSIGDFSSIWFNTVVRGDVNYIKIGSNSNIQDNSVLHVKKDTFPLTIGDDVTIGHRVVAHGCTIENKTLIGIGSIILDGAVIKELSIVGAGSLVPPGYIVPTGKLVLGTPCKVVRNLTDKETASIDELSANYVIYSKSYLQIK
jgi:gamma-carbonic anhydrase